MLALASAAIFPQMGGPVRFVTRQVEPEEREVCHSGSATLDTVGHLAEEKLIEFTCALKPGQYINGWKVLV